MKKGQISELKNELGNILNEQIEVVNIDDFIDDNQIPKGNKVYNIECSIMFVDIRNSTDMTDKNGRKNMVKIYKMFSKLVAKSVIENGGEIRQIIGDGVMCSFINDGNVNAGQKAVSTALTINTYLKEAYNPMVDQDWEIECGCGIRTGHIYLMRTKDKKYNLKSQIIYPSSITNYASKFCRIANGGNIIFDNKTHEHLNAHLKSISKPIDLKEYGVNLIIEGKVWKVE